MTSEAQIIPALQARLTALPLRRRAAKRVGALKQQRDVVIGAAQALGELGRVRQFVEEVFPSAGTDASGRALETARARAATLLRVFTSPDAIEDPSVDRALGELRRAVQSANAAINSEWKEQVAGVTERHSRLVEAIHRSDMPGSARLVANVERIRRMVDPPKTVAEAKRLSADVVAIVESIKGLGLEGPVGAFLTAVADHRGDPRALLDREVAAFLEEHKLWGVLAVSFR